MGSRRDFLRTTGTASIILLASNIFSFYQSKNEKPNILWITSEDNSPFLGCYGDDLATTPNLDKLASQGVLFENAYATAPVCAPARNSIITGMYPTSLGTQHMRSEYVIPREIKFYPQYLRDVGYYCTNNAKKDYNTSEPENVWDESSQTATYKNRAKGQPFFAIFNIFTSHESSLHKTELSLRHDPKKVKLPAYHPDTPEIRRDWAQYYDKVEDMDRQVGEILDGLEKDGLIENTIVFYYSDHGGALCRSKRFCYDSGLRVPFIIRFPKKYQHLSISNPGTSADQIVSFVDLAPTLFSLAGINIPEHIQGKPFLGKQRVKPNKYAYSFRGRMDERYDFCRTVRDKQFRYIRNYMPHRIYGQHVEYLWRAPATRSWEQAYLNGKCNDAQSIFWNSKLVEELYELENDPSEVNNLIDNPDYQEKCEELRRACYDWQKEIFDTGFIPESQMVEIVKTKSLYDFARSKEYQLDKIMEVANIATIGNIETLPYLQENLKNDDSIIRYWATVGFVILRKKAKPAIDDLTKCLNDQSISVSITVAEALCNLDRNELALPVLINALESENDKAVLYAANVFDCIGDMAKPALNDLKKILNHVNMDIQKAARHVVLKEFKN